MGEKQIEKKNEKESDSEKQNETRIHTRNDWRLKKVTRTRNLSRSFFFKKNDIN